jgi:F-type H+-transporting ATPase subunit b
LVDIDFGLLFVQAVTFGLAVLLLWRLFWKPLARFMRQRSERVERSIEEAEDARAQARRLEVDLRHRLAGIEAEARALLERAAKEGRAEREAVLAEAQAEAKRLIDEATRQIGIEREKTVRELRSETVTLAMLIAERALRQSVDPEIQQRLAREFIAGLKSG